MTSSPESIKHYTPVLLERFMARQQSRRHTNRRTNRKPLPINRHNVVPIGGPEQDLAAVSTRLYSTAEFAVFDNKEANALLIDAEAQVKSGFPTIATSSMVAKRSTMSLPDDMEFPPHIRFLNELVKPVEYRWKFQRERAKMLAPSKHGFHPRSQSPTFRRLLQATEKLQVILEKEAADGLEKPNASEALETERQHANETKSSSGCRKIKSERSSTRSSLTGIECTPPVKRLELHHREHPHRSEFKVTEPTIQEDESLGDDYDYDDEFETVEETPELEPAPTSPPAPPTRPPQRQTFKVDFKKMDSHSELHLFLPIIQDGLSRGATPEIPPVQPPNDKVDLVLPLIDDSAQQKQDKKDKSKKDQKQNEIKRRKKKLIHRTKSGNEEKVADILNDVPTLISMENEKNGPPKEDTPRPAMLVIPKQHHSSAMCVFENCVFHSHIKSVKVRQA